MANKVKKKRLPQAPPQSLYWSHWESKKALKATAGKLHTVPVLRLLATEYMTTREKVFLRKQIIQLEFGRQSLMKMPSPILDYCTLLSPEIFLDTDRFSGTSTSINTTTDE